MGLVGARCLKTARILAFALIMSCQTAFADATDAFYVSPSGSDSNAGTSPSKPFLTLDKAKTAMERSATKTTYVLGGMFSLSAPITLNGRKTMVRLGWAFRGNSRCSMVATQPPQLSPSATTAGQQPGLQSVI
jgi:hypothetical protein